MILYEDRRDFAFGDTPVCCGLLLRAVPHFVFAHRLWYHCAQCCASVDTLLANRRVANRLVLTGHWNVFPEPQVAYDVFS
jgi:hypothetical protein